MADETCDDPVVESVVAMLRQRSRTGVAKYGTTLAASPEGLAAFLRHLKEELADGLLYIEKIEALSVAAAPRDALIERLTGALYDMRSGWRYIRTHHGELDGVGWWRCEKSATEALEAAERAAERSANLWLIDLSPEALPKGWELYRLTDSISRGADRFFVCLDSPSLTDNTSCRYARGEGPTPGAALAEAIKNAKEQDAT